MMTEWTSPFAPNSKMDVYYAIYQESVFNNDEHVLVIYVEMTMDLRKNGFSASVPTQKSSGQVFDWACTVSYWATHLPMQDTFYVKE